MSGVKAVIQITIARFKVSFCFAVTVMNESHARGEHHVTDYPESR